MKGKNRNGNRNGNGYWNRNEHGDDKVYGKNYVREEKYMMG